MCHSILLHITSFLNLFVLFSLYVWITWVVTNIWWKCQVNSTFRNIFTEKNGGVFNIYFTRCKCSLCEQRSLLYTQKHFTNPKLLNNYVYQKKQNLEEYLHPEPDYCIIKQTFGSSQTILLHLFSSCSNFPRFTSFNKSLALFILKTSCCCKTTIILMHNCIFV